MNEILSEVSFANGSGRRRPIRHATSLVALGLALLAAAATPAAPPDRVRFDLRQDPERQGFFVQGEVDGRFDWQRGRHVAVALDSNAPAARFVAPLGRTLDGSTSFVLDVDFRILGLAASDEDFFQLSFGLINLAATGLNRTGTSLPGPPFFIDDADVFKMVELSYYPNVTFFGGPFLMPTVFGAPVGASAFDNFAVNFGPSSDLGANTGDAVRELPVGDALRARLVHDACRQQLVTVIARREGGREVILKTGLLPLDLSFLNAAGTFEVDAFAWNAFEDLADFDPGTPSLVADVELHAASVLVLPAVTARVLPSALNPEAGGAARIRVLGLAPLAAGLPLVDARLVEVDGVAVDVPLAARAVGGAEAQVELPRALVGHVDNVIAIDGCRIRVAAPPRVPRP